MSAETESAQPDGVQHQRYSTHRPRVPRPHLVSLPTSPLLAEALPHADWSDAYAVLVPRSALCRDAQQWADAIFHAPPLWIKVLFGVRELLVHCVGIERGGKAAFDTVSKTSDEVVLGVDQTHLDFRASVRVELDRVVLTTLVKVQSRRGAAYFALVRRVHPLIVRSMLARAARAMARPA
ncbi:MAG: DUF2867 domain-containing protein [Pedococcus sp.]